MKAAQQLAFLFITTIGYAQHEMTIGEQYQLKATDKIDLSVPSMPETTQQEFSVWGDEMPSELSEPPKIKIKKQQHSEPNNFYQHQIQKSKQKFNETFGTDKIKMSGHIPMSETHELSSDGETYIPKHQYYKEGVDNELYNKIKEQEENERRDDHLTIFLIMFGMVGVGIFVYIIFSKNKNKDYRHSENNYKERHNREQHRKGEFKGNIYNK